MFSTSVPMISLCSIRYIHSGRRQTNDTQKSIVQVSLWSPGPLISRPSRGVSREIYRTVRTRRVSNSDTQMVVFIDGTFRYSMTQLFFLFIKANHAHHPQPKNQHEILQLSSRQSSQSIISSSQLPQSQRLNAEQN